MALPTQIQIAPLDFDTIRADIKRYLQEQQVFADYNFQGSALSALIDVLAYDAYYHGWYTNFAVNESFLHTAQIRNSVVLAAKQVGYVPRSALGAVAIVDVTVGGIAPGEGLISIPRYTPFTTSVQGTPYTFYTIEDYTAYVGSSASVTFSEVQLYEGVKLTQNYTVSNTVITANVVVLPILSQNVDTRTVRVLVSPTVGEYYEYTRANTVLNVSATSNVYFLYENTQDQYEIQFGDNILGRSPSLGQNVSIEYLNTRGADGIGAKTFSYSGNPLGTLSQTSDVTITLSNANIPAFGGAPRESIGSIKRNAPAIYKTQGRIITPYDAKAVLLSEVGGIDSLTVWGGEDHDPPTYGKMFVALKPVSAEKFGSTQKEYIIQNVLKPKSLPTVRYELVDPDYIYLVVNSYVRYSPTETSYTADYISQLVATAVQEYATNELGQFGSYFKYSTLLSTINQSDLSIQSNQTSIQLEKRFIASAQTVSYQLKYSNPIYQPSSTANVVSVTTNFNNQLFSHPDESGIVRRGCYIENEQNAIHVYRIMADNTRQRTKSNVGTINFETGTITFSGFTPTRITTSQIEELRVRVIPRNSDLLPSREQIILIPADNIGVETVQDFVLRNGTVFGRPTAGGRLGSGAYSV